MAKQATHYFVYVGHSTQTKNKLQEEFGDYLRSLEAKLITADKIDDLKLTIKEKSIELNSKHKRCIPLAIEFIDMYKRDGFYIPNYYFLTFQILKAYDNN